MYRLHVKFGRASAKVRRERKGDLGKVRFLYLFVGLILIF